MSGRLDDIVFSAVETRRHSVVLLTLSLWSVAIGAAMWAMLAHPSLESRLVVGVLVLLAAVSYVPAGLGVWRKTRNAERLSGMFQSDRYLSQVGTVPSKEEFLGDVATEMANAQRSGDSCTMVVVGFTSLESVRSEHGDRIAHRAVEELGAKLVRAARGSDPLGYLGQGVFATLLLDCPGEHSRQFMRRLPGAIEVDDPLGRSYQFVTDMCGSEYDHVEEDSERFLTAAIHGSIRLEGGQKPTSKVA